MALKPDMSKAYAKVEWGYLKAILHKMILIIWWIYLVMRWVISVSYNIVHAVYDMDPFLLLRGIK